MPKNLQMSLLLDFYGPALTEKQCDVLSLYYNEDLSLAEIAEDSGITRQGVRDSIKRGEAIMLELEHQLGFAAWYGRVRTASDRIKAQLNELRAANAAGVTSAVDRSAAEIERLLDLAGEV